MSCRSAWIKASPVRSHCESILARRDLRGSNIIGYTTVTVHSHPHHIQPKVIQVRGSSCSNPVKRPPINGCGVCLRNGRGYARARRVSAEDVGVYERRDRAEVGLGKGG